MTRGSTIVEKTFPPEITTDTEKLDVNKSNLSPYEQKRRSRLPKVSGTYINQFRVIETPVKIPLTQTSIIETKTVSIDRATNEATLDKKTITTINNRKVNEEISSERILLDESHLVQSGTTTRVVMEITEPAQSYKSLAVQGLLFFQKKIIGQLRPQPSIKSCQLDMTTATQAEELRAKTFPLPLGHRKNN